MTARYPKSSAGDDDWGNSWEDPFATDVPDDDDPFAGGIRGDNAMADPFAQHQRTEHAEGPAGDMLIAEARGDRRERLLARRPRKTRSLPEVQQAHPTGSGATRIPRESTYVPLVLVLVGGGLAALMVYLGLAEVHPLSLDPLGNSLVFLTLSAAGLLLSTVGLAVAVRGAAVARPRYRPLLAIVLALTFVPLLVFGAGNLGLNDAKRRFQDSAATGVGRTLVGILTIIEDEGFPLGPLGNLTE